ncbi:hypothetical protein LXA43DRAFT_443895 [Ganoderma leucocontextum]|nr:hypothetical protein LXA43DRAFT_443895 [Ganoderma leucocontextum]
MPLIDSRRGITFAEINPDKRRCQYVFCQANGKYKACSRCKYARYCSAECQRADWPNHKKVCKSFKTPIMNAAVWRDVSPCRTHLGPIHNPSQVVLRTCHLTIYCKQTHADLFKWAAVHALQAHWAPDYVHTHGLLVHVLFGDRLHGASATPSHFEVTQIEALSFEEMKARTFGPVLYDARDLADCRRIQDEGGLGLAIALFEFRNAGPVSGKGAPCAYLVERYALTERRDPGCARVSSWRELENTVKGHINGVALPAMLDRPDAVVRPAANQVDQLVHSLLGLGVVF